MWLICWRCHVYDIEHIQWKCPSQSSVRDMSWFLFQAREHRLIWIDSTATGFSLALFAFSNRSTNANHFMVLLSHVSFRCCCCWSPMAAIAPNKEWKERTHVLISLPPILCFWCCCFCLFIRKKLDFICASIMCVDVLNRAFYICVASVCIVRTMHVNITFGIWFFAIQMHTIKYRPFRIRIAIYILSFSSPFVALPLQWVSFTFCYCAHNWDHW